MKDLTFVKDDGITGVEYGLILVVTERKTFSTKRESIKVSTKQEKNTTAAHIIKKETTTQDKKKKESKKTTGSGISVRRIAYTPLICSCVSKPRKKAPVDLSKKRYNKALTLFKKRQRAIKLAQRFVEPTRQK
ncbi:MAG: hypothetical protein J6W79_00205 [Alphaproteobacteria bacterium]|nr:hypothetical protein [Alphaproteobacteria bacterium]